MRYKSLEGKTVNRDEFVPQLEQVLEISPGTLREDQEVRDLEHWDSLKLLEIIALADEQLEVQMDADYLSKCVTVGDMLKLIEDTAARKKV
ncbi:MAG TPA: acyl carrier protein [Acidobacteriaceae bacterium]|nr:acyl carrier protein [Acidobacteriaceae bacterium]